ncbi:hypothetical protein TUZN_1421 [Thermoproteus uzoniensis 768-20]|uniref:DUF763 domain-containing protein n=1 Tax=Thermoproteus uzoniensis (strain 768-20) TaxID=999630 RepID=F2L1N8_THEU7|nr:DUF763 domain-containing protein [Thermoproteus uzoniensis]AEA12894.1 hypothetical protein TUZN_1421 [Thermoproteus uzoniensis 768-20]
MRLSGYADLPLHTGHVPPWLLSRMKKLSTLLLKIMYDLWGEEGILVRLASPVFFQAVNDLIGMDWDSSGSTTVTTAVLKYAMEKADLPIRIAGGKGAAALRTPDELRSIADRWGLDWARLAEASRLAAKVDNALVQDGYSIYHHAFVVTERGRWAVIQQGMNPAARMARRYHWLETGRFFDDPHSGIVGVRERAVLNLASSKSAGNRSAILDVVSSGPEKVARDLMLLTGQTTLVGLAYYHPYVDIKRLRSEIGDPRRLAQSLPRDVSSFKELLLHRGVGPKTLRALALVAELIYRSPADWTDPANVDPFKFSFAVGGKDGVPYPVDRKTYDELISLLEAMVDAARRSGDRGIYGYLSSLASKAAGWSPPQSFKRPTP